MRSNPVLWKGLRQARQGKQWKQFRRLARFTLVVVIVLTFACLFAGREPQSLPSLRNDHFACQLLATELSWMWILMMMAGCTSEWAREPGTRDEEKRTLDQMMLTPIPPRTLVLGKAFTVWLQCLLFLALFLPISLLLGHLPGLALQAAGLGSLQAFSLSLLSFYYQLRFPKSDAVFGSLAFLSVAPTLALAGALALVRYYGPPAYLQWIPPIHFVSLPGLVGLGCGLVLLCLQCELQLRARARTVVASALVFLVWYVFFQFYIYFSLAGMRFWFGLVAANWDLLPDAARVGIRAAAARAIVVWGLLHLVWAARFCRLGAGLSVSERERLQRFRLARPAFWQLVLGLGSLSPTLLLAGIGSARGWDQRLLYCGLLLAASTTVLVWAARLADEVLGASHAKGSFYYFFVLMSGMAVTRELSIFSPMYVLAHGLLEDRQWIWNDVGYPLLLTSILAHLALLGLLAVLLYLRSALRSRA